MPEEAGLACWAVSRSVPRGGVQTCQQVLGPSWVQFPACTGQPPGTGCVLGSRCCTCHQRAQCALALRSACRVQTPQMDSAASGALSVAASAQSGVSSALSNESLMSNSMRFSTLDSASASDFDAVRALPRRVSGPGHTSASEAAGQPGLVSPPEEPRGTALHCSPRAGASMQGVPGRRGRMSPARCAAGGRALPMAQVVLGQQLAELGCDARLFCARWHGANVTVKVRPGLPRQPGQGGTGAARPQQIPAVCQQASKLASPSVDCCAGPRGMIKSVVAPAAASGRG